MRDLRIFYAPDFHGSDLCFLKFINAGQTFEADALIFGGDLAGKSLVPERDGEFLVSTRIGKPTIAGWMLSHGCTFYSIQLQQRPEAF